MDEVVFDLFLAPLCQQSGGVGLQRIDARADVRRRVVPFHQLRRFFNTPAPLPSRHQPFGMRITHVRMRRLQIRKQPPGGVELAQIAAQHCVHEAGLSAESAAFGHLDGFVDGGVARDSVEPENLVKPEPGGFAALVSAGRDPPGGRSTSPRWPAIEPLRRPIPGPGGGRQAPAATRQAPFPECLPRRFLRPLRVHAKPGPQFLLVFVHSTPLMMAAPSGDASVKVYYARGI